MKKALSIMIIFLFVFTTVFANGAQESTSESSEPMVLQLAVTSAPGSNFVKGLEFFKKEVEQLTDKQIIIELHPGGDLYTQEGQAQAIRRGTLAMTSIGPEWFSDYVAKCSMFSAAYFLKDRQHMDDIFANEVGKDLFEEITDELGIRPLSSWYYGTRTLNLRDTGVEVTDPDDLKKVMLRMPNSPAFIKMGQALGANPTPMSFSEVYMGLKTGTIDGQDNPLGTTIEKKFYEATDYIILSKHFVNPDFLIINEDIWQSLSSDQQESMRTAAQLAKEYHDGLVVTAEEEAIAFLEGQGMKIVEVDIDVWKDYAQNFYLNDDYSKNWDMDFYKEIQSLAK